MSLINDALKRASQSDRNRQRQARTHTPMEPAASPPGQSHSLALGVGIVLALALAGWFFWQWWSARRPLAPVKVETAAVAPPVLRPAAPPVTTPPPARVAVVPPPTRMPAPTLEPVPAPPVKPAPAPWPVELRLMGIFFSQTNPQALINARTVSVGDEIDGIRVTRIERAAVTVEWSGQVKQLTLE